MIEIIAEDEGGAGDGFFGEEGEGDGVLISGVGVVGKVGGGCGGVAGKACG